eukprot:923855-Rhodomonas_salina.1
MKDQSTQAGVENSSSAPQGPGPVNFPHTAGATVSDTHRKTVARVTVPRPCQPEPPRLCPGH